MKKVLLLGGSAGVSIIGESLKKSGCEIYTYAKTLNPGLKDISEDYQVGMWTEIDRLKDYAQKVKPDFAFLGSTEPIANGLVDVLQEIGIQCIAPTKKASVLEFSKSFTRGLVNKYNIRGNPDFRNFKAANGLREYMEQLNGNFVVKADGLVMNGIGVKVSGEHLPDIESGIAFAKECIERDGHVVVEEKLIGPEFSFMFFYDGEKLVRMPAVQDHKRALEGDTGSNTGGMGAYSDANHLLPFLTANDLDEAESITYQILDAFKKETGVNYRGILYGGFMVTANGLKLMEYNVRVGDPEAINVFSILKTDFLEICEALLKGDLNSIKVEFDNKATVCKYIVPKGFPDHPGEGEKITIGDLVKNARMYTADVQKTDSGFLLGSSRAIAMVGIGKDLPEAEKFAEEACKSVQGPVQWRHDIGTQELIQKRIDLVNSFKK